VDLLASVVSRELAEMKLWYETVVAMTVVQVKLPFKIRARSDP
jgi:hypothetical protein